MQQHRIGLLMCSSHFADLFRASAPLLNSYITWFSSNSGIKLDSYLRE